MAGFHDLKSSTPPTSYATSTPRCPVCVRQPPSFSSPRGCSLVEFRLLSVTDVAAALRKLPDKQCDVMPTHVLKDCAGRLVDLVDLFNRSLRTGSVPTVFKAAYVSPLLKKPDLDAADVRSYRPISNLSVLS